ncbi:transposase [Patescibacteria group bacterium]|nr:transposase [Patescibacteria group bacterium]MBU0963614.1 transposase [Patescibacteria group bacterium]
MSRFFINNSYYFITIPTTRHIKFFNSPEKKSLILKRINLITKKYQLSDLNHSIISNHYHLIAYFKNANIIPKILQLINGTSAFQLNKITENKLPVWDEYYIYLIEDEMLLQKVQGYVVGNPLKHNEINTLEDLEKYPFSSYNKLIKKISRETVNEFIKSVIEFNDQTFISKCVNKT